MDLYSNDEFSGDVPTLEMVERVRGMLEDVGADQRRIMDLDPVIMAFLIRLLQVNGKQADKLVNQSRRLEELEKRVRSLQDQRAAMKVALQKFQFDLDSVQGTVADTAQVQKAYESIFTSRKHRSESHDRQG